MRVVFDTNVLFDLFLQRRPFLAQAIYLFDQVEKGYINGVITATAATTVFYIGRKEHGQSHTLRCIRRLLSRFEVAPVGRAVLEDALALGFTDFEDGVVHEAGRHVGAQAIVTRNVEDFAEASLSVYTPAELVRLLRAREEGFSDKNDP